MQSSFRINKKIMALLILAIVILWSASVQDARATTITYNATNIGGNTWEYDYTVFNDSLGFDIEQFTIYFSPDLYESLIVGDAPAGWDPLEVQPQNDPFDDGFYDALALSLDVAIAPGESLGGFFVSFIYLGLGAPGSQFFEIIGIDFDTFDLIALDSGETIPASVVPVPASVWLFGAALVGLVGFARRQSKKL